MTLRITVFYVQILCSSITAQVIDRWRYFPPKCIRSLKCNLFKFVVVKQRNPINPIS